MGPEAKLLSAPGVNHRTLIMIRWMAVSGQTLALLVVHYGLGISLPLLPAFFMVALSVTVNVFAIRKSAAPFPSQNKTAAYLAFDLLQLAGLLVLTGGLKNPFVILILAPVIVGTTLLSRRYALALAALALVLVSLLPALGRPLAWPDENGAFPPLYSIGLWFALILSIMFTGFYVWRTTSEARKLRDALEVLQSTLSHQQQVSALGAQAAATAHALGSPLNTISLIAGDLGDALPRDDPHYDDAQLLASEAERCRKILADFSRAPGEPAEDLIDPLTPLPLLSLIADQQQHENPAIDIGYNEEKTQGPPPLIVKSPELTYGLGNIIQNAVQFAQKRVDIKYGWDSQSFFVVISDDGKGIPPAILSRIGEPYVSGRGRGRRRARENATNANRESMGLGLFIARTLLEMTDASLTFRNGPEGGAEICVIWSRNSIDTGRKKT